ncbi:MAG TPA: SHOCT domain-containing protein [Bacilli bacterium]|nr:SHOCT domain-containing protein [Bacilli bacterium]
MVFDEYSKKTIGYYLKSVEYEPIYPRILAGIGIILFALTYLIDGINASSIISQLRGTQIIFAFAIILQIACALSFVVFGILALANRFDKRLFFGCFFVANSVMHLLLLILYAYAGDTTNTIVRASILCISIAGAIWTFLQGGYKKGPFIYSLVYVFLLLISSVVCTATESWIYSFSLAGCSLLIFPLFIIVSEPHHKVSKFFVKEGEIIPLGVKFVKTASDADDPVFAKAEQPISPSNAVLSATSVSSASSELPKSKNNFELIEEIKKLKELLDLGAISQEEFDERKKLIMQKMDRY